jgi:hypothetical protein
VRLKQEMAEEFARQMTVTQNVREGAVSGLDSPEQHL